MHECVSSCCHVWIPREDWRNPWRMNPLRMLLRISLEVHVGAFGRILKSFPRRLPGVNFERISGKSLKESFEESPMILLGTFLNN